MLGLRCMKTSTNANNMFLNKITGESASVGLVILQCINLIGMCQWGIRQTAEVENLMTAVERIMEYAELPSEAALESTQQHRPPTEWPTKGEIVFKDFNFKYSSNSDFVLKNINLHIMPKVSFRRQTSLHQKRNKHNICAYYRKKLE